jgi:hypothetical protein
MDGIIFSIPTMAICILGKVVVKRALPFVLADGYAAGIGNQEIGAGNAYIGLQVFFAQQFAGFLGKLLGRYYQADCQISR